MVRRLSEAEEAIAPRWASLLAHARDAQPSDSSIRINAILDRFESDLQQDRTNSVWHGYLSANAMKMNALLVIFPTIDQRNVASIVRDRFSKATNVTQRSWLLMARGMCRDESAGEELKTFITNPQRNVSERALALKAYVVAVGSNATPLLNQLCENSETGDVPGLPPNEQGMVSRMRPLQVVAKDELAFLKYPELRLKFRGY